MAIDYGRLYAEFRALGLREIVINWHNLVTFYQYKLSFDLTQRHALAGGQVLDWGCGNGHFSYFLAKAGYRPSGYSFDPPPILLKDQPTFRFVSALPESPVKLPFADAEFNAVFSMGVLEHVRETGGDPAASVRELYRVLKPGGRFLCFHLPNSFSWIEFVARRVHAVRPSLHVHLDLYDRPAIEHLLAGAGFTIEHLGRYAFLPRGIFARLPRAITDNAGFAASINALDVLLSAVFRPLCQNWYVIAVK